MIRASFVPVSKLGRLKIKIKMGRGPRLKFVSGIDGAKAKWFQRDTPPRRNHEIILFADT